MEQMAKVIRQQCARTLPQFVYQLTRYEGCSNGTD
jgi:hypothetical protein